MPLLGHDTCPACGRAPGAGEVCCSLCGHLFARPAPGALFQAPDRPAPSRPLPESRGAAVPVSVQRLPLGLSPEVFYLGLGAVIAPVFVLPFPRWVGWYFSALVHEMGHAGAAWSLGCAAVPALGVGQAVTVESAQSMLLTFGVWAAGLFAGWSCLAGRPRRIVLGLLICVYPLLAFTSFGTLVKLFAGHGAELAFAGLAFWRALTGGFTSSNAERGLYAVLAWFLIADNIHLSLGLVVSQAARSEYAGNGSFGCVNDYIRIADGWFGGSLQGVALLATLPALAVLPIVLLLRHWALRFQNPGAYGARPPALPAGR